MYVFFIVACCRQNEQKMHMCEFLCNFVSMESNALISPKTPPHEMEGKLSYNTGYVPKENNSALYSSRSLQREVSAIWSMAWKVSLSTFCRISLMTISTCFLGHIGSKELAAAALAGVWTSCVQIFIYGFAMSICTVCVCGPLPSVFISIFSYVVKRMERKNMNW